MTTLGEAWAQRITNREDWEIIHADKDTNEKAAAEFLEIFKGETISECIEASISRGEARINLEVPWYIFVTEAFNNFSSWVESQNLEMVVAGTLNEKEEGGDQQLVLSLAPRQWMNNG